MLTRREMLGTLGAATLAATAAGAAAAGHGKRHSVNVRPKAVRGVVAVGRTDVIVHSASAAYAAAPLLALSASVPVPSVGSAASPGADPNVVNTAGIPNGTTLTTITGDYTVATNEALTAKHITGDLYVQGSGVTITNCLIDGEFLPSQYPGGNWNVPPTGCLIQHSEWHSAFTTGFDGVTIVACKVASHIDGPGMQAYDYTGGAYAHNLVIQDSWFTPPPNASSGDPHIEAIHMGGVIGATITNTIFDYRTTDPTTLNDITAPVSIGQAESSGTWPDYVRLDHCTLYGGRYYSILFVSTNINGQSAITNCSFVNDSPDFDGVQYPITSYATLPAGGYPRFAAAGNVLNGSPVTLDGQI